MSEPLKYILLICITAFLAAGVYLYKPISKGVDAFSVTKPCSEPLRYSIGNLDSRFAIDEEEVEEAARTAASLWNRGNSAPVLTQIDSSSEKPDIIIQLVYDERQDRTNRELRFREQIRSEQIRLDQQQAAHDRKRERFDERSKEYRQFAEQTSKDLENLNEWVKDRNKDGGLTEEELEQFERRKSEVENQQRIVRQQRKELEEMARSINREMESLNSSFEEHNKLIDRYNDEYAGDLRFTKATYQKATDGGVVTINQFMNRKELILIIAHELGHALGIKHLETPESVMFNLMGTQQLNPVLQLSNADKNAVQQICD